MSIQNERQRAISLGVLLLITIVAVALQKMQLNKILTIDAASKFSYKTLDDRGNGGASIANVEVDGRKLILHCQIIPSNYQWPYCEIQFRLLEKGSQGMDLSDYSHARVWAKYSTPQDVGIRFQTQNFDPSYSSITDPDSLKYNVIEYHDKKAKYPVILPLKNFQVPTWWLVAKDIPIENIGPEFNNTHVLEIATGNSIKPGKYDIIIERIELVGKHISDKNLYLFLLSIWALAALIYFLNTVRNIRKELKQSGHRQQELEALNNLLNVKHQRLEKELVRDPLTGVMNRAGIVNLFNSSANRPLNLSIMFIDLDHFKKVNDTYGHNVGDQVLIQFAKSIEENTREHDVLARWGGEEFILACPNTELSHAVQLAEKLRANIASQKWPQNALVTASFGVAEMYNESPTEFIARADKALYDAKAKGRNCVVIAEKPTQK